MKHRFISFFFLFIIFSGFSQEKKKSVLKPYKIGFLYNYGTNENFIFDDIDYTYAIQTIKCNFFTN